ncbi:YncE family protein [Desulfobacterota bacterium M19]
MLKKIITGSLLVLPLLFPVGAGAKVKVEATPIADLRLSSAPLDTAISGDGQSIFVLTEDGRVEIYDRKGRRKGSVKLSGKADRLAVSPDGNTLFLTDSARHMVRMTRLSFVHDISTKGSPFKGPADAPVVIAIFSDYQ